MTTRRRQPIPFLHDLSPSDYIETTIPPGMTIAEYRRSRRPTRSHERRGPLGWLLPPGRGPALAGRVPATR